MFAQKQAESNTRGWWKIKLVNDGEADISSRPAVEVRWCKKAAWWRPTAWRGLQRVGPGVEYLAIPDKNKFDAGSPVAWAKARLIGWMRFDTWKLRCKIGNQESKEVIVAAFLIGIFVARQFRVLPGVSQHAARYHSGPSSLLVPPVLNFSAELARMKLHQRLLFAVPSLPRMPPVMLTSTLPNSHAKLT